MQTNTIFMIQVALHKNIDSITIIVLMSCSENANQHDNERGKKTLEGSNFSKVEQLTEWDIEPSLGLRHEIHIKRGGKKRMTKVH